MKLYVELGKIIFLHMLSRMKTLSPGKTNYDVKLYVEFIGNYFSHICVKILPPVSSQCMLHGVHIILHPLYIELIPADWIAC